MAQVNFTVESPIQDAASVAIETSNVPCDQAPWIVVKQGEEATFTATASQGQHNIHVSASVLGLIYVLYDSRDPLLLRSAFHVFLLFLHG